MAPIDIFGYVSAWDLPDISPYVCKVVFYCKMAGIEFEYRNQDLTKLDDQTPHGKLPVIQDGPTKVGDSNTIISYLENKHGGPLDGDMSKIEKAQALAWNRLIEEHLYWAGIIEPRWKQDRGWETYIPYIVNGAEVSPDLRKFLDDFRQRILNGFNGQGMGRRKVDVVLDFYKLDIDAISDFLADKKYFMGDKPRTIDASLYAIVRHLLDQPQKWEGSGYLEAKKNIVDYAARMRQQYNM